MLGYSRLNVLPNLSSWNLASVVFLKPGDIMGFNSSEKPKHIETPMLVL